jgi:hypothetical protein
MPGPDSLRLPGITNGVNLSAIGDVEGTGGVQIVTPAANDPSFGAELRMFVVSAAGQILRTIRISPNRGDLFASPPVLADLDSDGIPEIVVQLDNSLHVFTRTGEMRGFPITFDARSNGGATIASLGNSIPVIGDIDGDGAPEIVVMVQITSTPLGDLHAFRLDGTEVAGFPKRLVLGAGAVSAIGDLDGDGKNELVVRGPDALWVFDIHHGLPTGRIEWGQFGAGPRHNFEYIGPATAPVGTPPTPGCVQVNGGTCCYSCGCASANQPCTRDDECCSGLCGASTCSCARSGVKFPAALAPGRAPCCSGSWTVAGCDATCL